MAQAASQQGDETPETAPTYSIPSRRLSAVEHPMIVKDIDKAVRTFGQTPAFRTIVDSASPQVSVPLYLRYDNPTVSPLNSHNTATHNVVLKVTVPRRTGRKRKRGTNDLFEGDVSHVPAPEPVSSQSGQDAPRILRRKLRDNVGKYAIEPVGVIKNTHRYRGFADFQYALGNSQFMKQFVDKVMPGDVSRLREFTLAPGTDRPTGVDIMPPPFFTSVTLPFQYNYAQNQHTKEVGDTASASGDEDDEFSRIVNVTSRVSAAGFFLRHDEYPVPAGPRYEPDMSDSDVAKVVNEMRRAMEERPIWTRRSLWNRLASTFGAVALPKSGALIKHCLPFVGYQFKGGPWRDAMVRYGVDPRSDPKYRGYQTLIFKLHKTRVGSIGRSWHSVRRSEGIVTNYGKFWSDKTAGGDDGAHTTHVFDGTSYHTDGKVWQVCDITDPLLARLFAEATVRPELDVEVSGWYHGPVWAVGKAIMKAKMLAIRFDKTLTDDDFRETVRLIRSSAGDNQAGSSGSRTSIGISLPNMQLTDAERQVLRVVKMRPGRPTGNRDRWEEMQRRKSRSSYLHRQRIHLKEGEEQEVLNMVRILGGSDGDGEAASENVGPPSRQEPGLPGANEDDAGGPADGETLPSFIAEFGEDDDEDEDTDIESGSGSDMESEDEDDEDDIDKVDVRASDEDEDGADGDGFSEGDEDEDGDDGEDGVGRLWARDRSRFGMGWDVEEDIDDADLVEEP